jgi:hypothetical protein
VAFAEGVFQFLGTYWPAIKEQWFDLFQTVGIIAALLLTYRSLRDQAQQLKMSNLLLVTQHHRELWGYMLDHSDLVRVFDKQANIKKTPITERERTFANMVFLHSAACLAAQRAKVMPESNNFAADVAGLFSYPIPRVVWNDVMPFVNPEFARFVKESRDKYP